jgi:ferredoxin--NADP+ reductase
MHSVPSNCYAPPGYGLFEESALPYSEERITEIHRWSPKTFSFKATRPSGFRFENGQFVTLGLRLDGRLIPRAYSIVSDPAESDLEFLSIHVPDGPLTSELARVNVGDKIWINSKITGSLTLRHVQPGRHLYLLATGTGIAPFISLVRGEQVFDRYAAVILVHSVRTAAELSYREELEGRSDHRFRYVPTVTRETFPLRARGADLFRSGELFAHLGLPPADPEHDRVMLCGNPQMNREMAEFLRDQGWVMTNYKGVGNFTVEQAFVSAQPNGEQGTEPTEPAEA